MASGILPGSIIEASSLQPALDDRSDIPARPPLSDHTKKLDDLLSGSDVGQGAVSVVSAAKGGALMQGFSDDWYYRVHVIPGTINVGNLLAVSQTPVEIWNAHFASKTLNSITEDGTDGITLVGPVAPPTAYAALESRTYTATVLTSGPATISATFDINFQDSESPQLLITGLRVIAFAFGPNWAEALVERLEYATHVMESYDGSEQRVKLRSKPRRTFEFEVWAENDVRRRDLETKLFDWQSRVWGVPVWTDGAYLGQTVTAGATNIPVVTASRDYEAGGSGIIVEGSSYEFFEVVTVNANSVDIKTALGSTWGPGAIVAPARSARMEDIVRLERITDENLKMKVRFSLEDADARVPPSESADYRGLPVLEKKPNAANAITHEMARDLKILDFITGKRSVDDRTQLPAQKISYSWLLNGRMEIDDHRMFLMNRAGRLKPIWIPSWTKDLVLAQRWNSGTANFYVEDTNYSTHIAQAVSRRDLRIKLNDGTILYRRIVSSTTSGVPAGQELLTLDTVAPYDIDPEDVMEIMFMAPFRMDSDGVELAWETATVAQCSTSFRSLRDSNL